MMYSLLILLFNFNFGSMNFIDSILNKYNFSNPEFICNLPEELNEISGLAVSSEGKIFTHDDELGIIYQIDFTSCKIIKKFFLGDPVIKGDFEGIEIANNKFYLVTSDGILYSFSEGKENQIVEFEKVKLDIADKFEIEGLCYYPEKNSLLLAIKYIEVRKYDDLRPVFEFDLSKNNLLPNPIFQINIRQLKSEYKFENFFPSGIAYSKQSNTLLITGSRDQKAVIETDTDGNIINAIKLKKEFHPQPEGISMVGNLLLISDESKNEAARLTVYKQQK